VDKSSNIGEIPPKPPPVKLEELKPRIFKIYILINIGRLKNLPEEIINKSVYIYAIDKNLAKKLYCLIAKNRRF
jgi:hypothetical protein